MKTLLMPLLLTLLCLTGCGKHLVRDGAPASDLDTMVANVERELAPRKLPNGKLYCAEDARTMEQLADCAGDVEDALWLSEGDKARALKLIKAAAQRLRLQRNPCGFWERLSRRERCMLD